MAHRHATRKAPRLGQKNEANALIDQAEKLKAIVRAKVEYAFRVINRQFGSIKVRYRSLKKNTAQQSPESALKTTRTAHGSR